MNTELLKSIGGIYELPDGRCFWIDDTAARAIAARVEKFTQAQDERISDLERAIEPGSVTPLL